MNPFKSQQAIRNNASELSDYLSDLKSWNTDMNKKEQQYKQREKDKKPTQNDDLPPIRNQIKSRIKLQKNEELSLKFKTEGNDYFKEGKYHSAIQSYTKAIESNPDNAVLYSNRAMAKLKTKAFQSAETDCTKCIELDSAQIKAHFRRGLARKSLKKYNKALADFEIVLKMDTNNKAAKRERNAMKTKLELMYKKSKQKVFGKNVPKKNNKMKRIVIEECEDSDSDSDSDSSMESKDEIKSEKTVENIPKTERKSDIETLTVLENETFEMKRLPRNFIEFEKIWNRARLDKNRALILLGLKGKGIDKIIKNMIDDRLFAEMIKCVYYITMNESVCDALEVLTELTRLDRFEMIVMFMNESEKKLLKDMKDKCEEQNLNVSVFDKFE